MKTDTQRRARDEFDALVRDIRPELHRYCARLVGSAIDGEDVVQDALARAYYQLSQVGDVVDLRGWLFRVAHNRAIDYLRRYDVRFGEVLTVDVAAPEAGDPIEQLEVARLGLSYFTKLPPAQRGCVVLKDVLGYSLEQVAAVLDLTVPAVKGSLHRGRARLQRLVEATADRQTPPLSTDELARLARYADLFNARDFDRLRETLAADVRLDLIGRIQARGAPVGQYFSNYRAAPPYRARLAVVEGRPALVIGDEQAAEYLVLIRWTEEVVAEIRDYRYARYVLAEARVTEVRQPAASAS